MKTEEALEIVYQLADQNALDKGRDKWLVENDEALAKQASQQREALNVVHDLIVNEYGEYDDIEVIKTERDGFLLELTVAKEANNLAKHIIESLKAEKKALRDSYHRLLRLVGWNGEDNISEAEIETNLHKSMARNERLMILLRDACIGHEDNCSCPMCQEAYRHE